MDAAPLLGLAAGGLGVADSVPYLRDIRRGRTRPQRATWLIWGVLAIVVALPQWADGATWSLVLPASQAVLTAAIFSLALRHGTGGVSRGEWAMVALAGAGVAGWLVADAPLAATVCVVAADLIGVALMLPKTYRDPESETLVTYALGSLSGALASGAVAGWNPALLLYPAYYCLGNGAIALLILRRRAVREP